ncbi:MAG: DUF2868 domain-containing protein [Gammaproteobacteria bacterium]
MSTVTDNKLSAFQQRLLAEGIRVAEEAGTTIPGNDTADVAAIAAGGSFEERIRTRAVTLARAQNLLPAFTMFQRGLRIALIAIIALGFVIGAGAAKSTLTPDADGLVNFYWTLVVLLGLHTLAMLLWLLFLLFGRYIPPLTPLVGIYRGLSRLFTKPAAASLETHAYRAWASSLASGALGRWGISTLLHSFWLAALSGILVTTVVLFIPKQFDFVWETTMLPDQAFIRLTDTLRPLPQWFGMATLDRDTVLASHRNADQHPPAEARRGWSSLLIGSIFGAGLLPRFLMWLASVLMLYHARSRYRLDLELPGFARLQHRLMPVSQRIGVVDPDLHGPASTRAPDGGRVILHDENTAVLGLDIDTPRTGWPPVLLRVRSNLGIATDRDTLIKALGTLANMQSSPLSLIIVCSLISSPDRGMAKGLREIRAAHHGSIGVLLTQSTLVNSRLGHVAAAERLQDWRQLIHSAGVDLNRVLTLDLDDAEVVRNYQLAQTP